MMDEVIDRVLARLFADGGGGSFPFLIQASRRPAGANAWSKEGIKDIIKEELDPRPKGLPDYRAMQVDQKSNTDGSMTLTPRFDKPRIFTEENFRAEIKNATVPVVVDFWADWCGPCRMLSPVLEQIAADMEGKVIVAKVDVDQCPNLAGEFNVRSIPMMVFFKDGRPKETIVGVVPRDRIDKTLASL